MVREILGLSPEAAPAGVKDDLRYATQFWLQSRNGAEVDRLAGR